MYAGGIIEGAFVRLEADTYVQVDAAAQVTATGQAPESSVSFDGGVNTATGGGSGAGHGASGGQGTGQEIAGGSYGDVYQPASYGNTGGDGGPDGKLVRNLPLFWESIRILFYI